MGRQDDDYSFMATERRRSLDDQENYRMTDEKWAFKKVHDFSALRAAEQIAKEQKRLERKENMEKSENIGELAEALSKLQGLVEDPVKNKSAHKCKYADLPQVLQILRPLLSSAGLSVSQFPGIEEDKITIETMLMHKSGQWISSVLKMNALGANSSMNKAQEMGAVITYGRRYALTSLLGIAADEDTDANPNGANSNNKASAVQIETLLKLLNNDKDRIQKMMGWLHIDNINNLTLDHYLKAMEEINKPKAQGE